MTDQELKDLVASLAVESSKTEKLVKETSAQQKKTDEQMKKTDEQMKKTDEKLERIGIRLGNIGANQGDVAEEYFINSLENSKLKIADMNFDYLMENFAVSKGGQRDEFDIILVNGESLAIIEVKYKVHPNDVDKLDSKIINIKKLSSHYKDFKVYAGIAGFKIPKDAIEKALKKGYFVLQRKGDIVETYMGELKVA